MHPRNPRIFMHGKPPQLCRLLSRPPKYPGTVSSFPDHPAATGRTENNICRRLGLSACPAHQAESGLGLRQDTDCFLSVSFSISMIRIAFCKKLASIRMKRHNPNIPSTISKTIPYIRKKSPLTTLHISKPSQSAVIYKTRQNNALIQKWHLSKRFALLGILE